MIKFKELREAVTKKTVPVEDPEEAKLDDLPTDESQLDDADENNRNPDGDAENMVVKAFKPIYKKTKNGTYTLNTEEKAPSRVTWDFLQKSKKGKYHVKVGNKTHSYHPDKKSALNTARALVKKQMGEDLDLSENVIDDLKKLSSLAQSGTVKFVDGSSAKVDSVSADAILKTMGALNTNNQKKMAKRLSSSAKEFAKMQRFALQQAKRSDRLKSLVDL